MTARERLVLVCAMNADLDGAPWESSMLLAADKRASASLERRGLVTVRRTADRVAGSIEWWVRITPAGIAALTEVGGLSGEVRS